MSEIIEKLREDQKLLKLFDRLEDYADDTVVIPDMAIEGFITLMFDLSDNLPDSGNFWGMKSFVGANRLVYQLLQRRQDLPGNAALLRKIIPKTTGLYGPVYFMALEASKEPKTPGSEVLEEKDVPALTKLCVAKIKKADADGSLYDHPDRNLILFRWREWAGDAAVKAAVNKYVETDEHFLNFLEGFVHTVRRQQLSDYVSEEIKQIQLDNLKAIMDLDEVKGRLATIKSGKLRVKADDIRQLIEKAERGDRD